MILAYKSCLVLGLSVIIGVYAMVPLALLTTVKMTDAQSLGLIGAFGVGLIAYLIFQETGTEKTLVGVCAYLAVLVAVFPGLGPRSV